MAEINIRLLTFIEWMLKEILKNQDVSPEFKTKVLDKRKELF